MPIVKANNINIYYEIHGNGTPLILIGGLASDHNGWETVLGEFAKKFQVIIFDNRGAGQSDVTPAPYSTQLLAEDVVGLMDALEIPSAHVLGHSLGSAIAQQLAINFPEKIKKLIIHAPFIAPLTIPKMAMSVTETLLQQKIAVELIARYNIPWLYSADFIEDPQRLSIALDRMAKKRYPITALGFQNQAAAYRSHNTRDSLKQIKHPTLIIAGEDDLMSPLKISKEIMQALPKAKYVMIPKTAHLAHVEKPAEFIGIVLEFLS